MEHGGLVEVTERREVILTNQDVRVPQIRQVLLLGIKLMLNVLQDERENQKGHTHTHTHKGKHSNNKQSHSHLKNITGHIIN